MMGRKLLMLLFAVTLVHLGQPGKIQGSKHGQEPQETHEHDHEAMMAGETSNEESATRSPDHKHHHQHMSHGDHDHHGDHAGKGHADHHAHMNHGDNAHMNHGNHDPHGNHAGMGQMASNGHNNHDSMDMMGHTMKMYFHASVKTTILFSFWHTESWEGLFGSCLLIFVMAVLYEGLKLFREYLLRRSNVQRRYKSVPVSTSEEVIMEETRRSVRSQLLSCGHLVQTLLHVLQVVTSYLLMLVFMTYNVYLCTAVALGAGAGYFCFSWGRAVVVDTTEHCH